MYSKDYYSILGVLPTAEIIVIRAAYKALAQRYHPDKCQGDRAEANRMMKEINEAYGVLSDVGMRKQYDQWYKEQHKSDEYQVDEDEELSAAMKGYDKDWKLASDIYPELNDQFARLNRIAHRLAMTYKIFLLESKQFAISQKLALEMEENFFRTYFGANPMLLDFAKEVVLGGHKMAAKMLNEYIRVLGSGIDARKVIDKVCGDTGVVNKYKAKEDVVRREMESAEVARKIAEKEAERKFGVIVCDIEKKIRSGKGRLTAEESAYIAESKRKNGVHLSEEIYRCFNCFYTGSIVFPLECPACGAVRNIYRIADS